MGGGGRLGRENKCKSSRVNHAVEIGEKCIRYTHSTQQSTAHTHYHTTPFNTFSYLVGVLIFTACAVCGSTLYLPANTHTRGSLIQHRIPAGGLSERCVYDPVGW